MSPALLIFPLIALVGLILRHHNATPDPSSEPIKPPRWTSTTPFHAVTLQERP